jgi:hypothetical protein
MMQSGSVRLREREHVVVAAVRAVHERDDLTRVIRKAQAKHVAVERHRAHDIRREHEDVRQVTRVGGRGLRARGRRRFAVHALARRIAPAIGRDLVGAHDLDRDAFGIGDPHAFVVGEPMRRSRRHAERAQALDQRVVVFRVCAERDVLQPLAARALVNRCPAMRMPERVKVRRPSTSRTSRPNAR